MARINTNIPSVLAQRNLRSIQSELQTRFERLSTGLRINRISATASFGSLKLLNGSLDYNLSGVNPNEVVQARVWNASFVSQSVYNVQVNVVASAQTGALYFQPPTGAGTVLSATTLQ